MGVQDRRANVVAEDVWVTDVGVDLDPRRTKGVVVGKFYCQMKSRVSMRRQDETGIGQILVVHLKLDVWVRALLELGEIGAQALAEVRRGHFGIISPAWNLTGWRSTWFEKSDKPMSLGQVTIRGCSRMLQDKIFVAVSCPPFVIKSEDAIFFRFCKVKCRFVLYAE